MAEPKKANVVFVLTDDGGYGDLACHGNEYLQTPNIDMLHDEGVRFADFHVSPCCSPSRAQLMSGRYANRTGVWHTVQGRSLIHKDEITMADVFKNNGYVTGIFGKWHLGDNYPYRPQDRGFDEVYTHGGGGVGNIPDYWANNYFHNTFFRDGVPEEAEGFCCDVWFREASEFIEHHKEEPFFCYIPTNTPHLPFVCEDQYFAPYDRPEISESMGKFYGMITNIDDNVGKIRNKIKQLGLERDTIFIFMTDNGSSRGWRDEEGYYRYNAGMRGGKGSAWDGGHRVPFFLHYPAGGFEGGRDIERLCAGFDVLPTLMDLCDLQRPDGPRLDGVSLVPAMEGKPDGLSERIICVDNQRITHPRRWRTAAVMSQQWRLVKARNQAIPELFDIKSDPGQQTDLSEQHPEIVQSLSDAYEQWWDSWRDARERQYEITIGSEAENPVCLTAHDLNGAAIWNHDQVLSAKFADGYWVIDVEKSGEYEFGLRRWPREVEKPILSEIEVPEKLKKLVYYSKGLDYAITHDTSQKIEATYARIQIDGIEEEHLIDSDTTEAKFRLKLEKGPARLQTWFVNGADDGGSIGAYYVYVTRI